MEISIERKQFTQFNYKGTWIIIRYTYGGLIDPVPLRADIYMAPDFTVRQKTLARISWSSFAEVSELVQKATVVRLFPRFIFSQPAHN
jgi:hypothetical protein